MFKRWCERGIRYVYLRVSIVFSHWFYKQHLLISHHCVWTPTYMGNILQMVASNYITNRPF